MNTTDTMLITSDNTPYQSDEDEKQYEVTYHSNPERIRQLNPKSRAEQAYLFCNACKQWKKLSAANITTIDFSLFSRQKQYYTSGCCLTDECYEEVERHIRACIMADEEKKLDEEKEKEQEEQEERFWSQSDILQNRCDESDRKCDALFKKLMNEQNEK